MNKLEKVREIVKKEGDKEVWKYHMLPVVEYSKLLAKNLNANKEITELSALLHDIGKLKFGGENHGITGQKEAEKILRKLNYPQKVIEEVKHCVESHGGNKGIKPKTKIARIISNADAMAHFDNVFFIFYWRCKKEGFEDALKWLQEKIEREWNKKLIIPYARKLMQQKYKAINLLFP